MTNPTNVADARCMACLRRQRAGGLLCFQCSDTIACSTLLPEHIHAADENGEGTLRNALIDQWGRAHALADVTPIGRRVVVNGIVINDASVSRSHAQVLRTDETWSLINLGSTNGTFIERELVIVHTLVYGDRISFGSVGFYAVFDVERVTRVDAPAITTSVSPMKAAPLPLRITEPTGGGGGFVELADACAQLSVTQLQLLDVLSRRMRDDAHLPQSVRGFVRSSELVGALSWDTHDPDDSHVKHLVRRTRRTTVRSGLGDLIESRHGLGYRLRMFPQRNIVQQATA